MYSRPSGALEGTARGRQAQDLLRACVHCGFCLPACPTYRILGNELDSPRGRIYLVKQLIEGGPAGKETLTHLDRCLTCRACETACPSGVQYGRIIDLGRELAEERIGRPIGERALRFTMAAMLGRRRVFESLLRVGSWMRPLLPASMRARLPRSEPDNGTSAAANTSRPGATAPATLPAATQFRPHDGRRTRRVVLLEGCVQPGLAPGINAAASRVLDRLGIATVRARGETCCGALSHHRGRTQAALGQARRNIEACAELLDAGAECVLSTASACGLMVKDYGRLLADDPSWAERARGVADATRDLSELIEPADLRSAGLAPGAGPSVAWQSPCTLQHGQHNVGRVEALLAAAGYRLTPVSGATICCGSAGTYSVLQPALSRELRTRKLESLTAGRPDMIATANIGCLMHLRESSSVPVRHWIELVDAAFAGRVTVESCPGVPPGET
ncbi:MAG: glycolate oxidase subunit GlcF [Steroidobacteraceae bacterium]|nr:glycolate oxidase subunit GlcF [Steroidobacteraceae bacterium]